MVREHDEIYVTIANRSPGRGFFRRPRLNIEKHYAGTRSITTAGWGSNPGPSP